MRRTIIFCLTATVWTGLHATAWAQSFGLRDISRQSAECIECHKKQSRALYEQWGASKHSRAKVGGFDFHEAQRDD